MKLYVNGRECELESAGANVRSLGDRLAVTTSEGTFTAVAVRSGDSILVSFRGRQYRVETKRPRSIALSAAASGEIRAPMPGQIVDVLVEEGASVEKGERILVLEAMKTQQAFTAPFDGTVAKLLASKGDQVVDGALLALVQPTEASE